MREGRREFSSSFSNEGLLLVNVGLISWTGYQLYTDPFLRRDTSFLATAGISALVLFGIEGYAVDKYAQTPGGEQNRRRAKQEGSAIYRKTREVVLRPGVMGGLIGLANVGILSTVGYYAYINWDRPTWDRGTVAAVSAGLLVLAGGEGFVYEPYSW